MGNLAALMGGGGSGEATGRNIFLICQNNKL